MRQLTLLILSISSLSLSWIGAQDSLDIKENNIILSGTAGNITLAYQFDSLDVDRIQSAMLSFDTLLNNQSRLQIYGHNIFNLDSLAFGADAVSTKITDGYVLSDGDEIAITIFGASQYEGKFIIDNEGFISQKDELPKILLKGLKWKEAKKLLQRRFSNYFRFRSDQFGASIVSPRTITVNIFGEVNKPGSYVFSATNSAFNALKRAEGPTSIGSVRNIMISNYGSTRILDLYELYNNPEKQFDLYIEDNTVIQVPVAEKIVEIRGAINRPLKYELTSNEGLADLIDFAGGLAPNAIQENIQILRFDADQQTIIDASSRDISNNLLLLAGDIVTIKEIKSDDLKDFVKIEGAVNLPGDYSLISSPNVATLLSKAGLLKSARKDVAYLVRTKPNGAIVLIKLNLDDILSNSDKDIILQNKDKLIVSDLENFIDKSTIKVSGAVRTEIEFPFDSDSKVYLSQVIFLAGGLNPEASGQGYIIRSNQNNLKEKEYVPINVRDALKTEFGADDILLLPWDEVLILSTSSYTDQKTVSVRGNVRNPSTIEYDQSLKLKDLIILCGGLQSEASRKISVVRVNIDQENSTTTTSIPLELDENYNIIAGPTDFRLLPFDEIIVRKVPEFELQKFVKISGEVISPGDYSLSSDGLRISDIIERSGGLTSEAFVKGTFLFRILKIDSNGFFTHFRIITDIEEIMRNKNSPYNHILRNGDIISIPKKVSTVRINLTNTRAMDQSISSDSHIMGVRYVPGKSAKWYIEEFAGGFARGADKNDVTVEYANGIIKKSKGGLFRKSAIPEVGSIIRIGDKGENLISVEEQPSKYAGFKKGVIINIDSEKGEPKTKLLKRG